MEWKQRALYDSASNTYTHTHTHTDHPRTTEIQTAVKKRQLSNIFFKGGF